MAALGLVTVTEFTAGCGLTVTVTLPLFVASNVDVAVIVAVPTATPVTSPLGDTLAIVAFDDDQVTLVAAPLTTATAALSCAVAPTATVGFAGVTVTETTAGAGGVTVT
jgi:hypothetical protein